MKGRRSLIVAMRDITDRILTEKALQDLSAHQEALLSAIPDIIMEVDADKVYTWANQAGLDFFGDEVIGKEAIVRERILSDHIIIFLPGIFSCLMIRGKLVRWNR